MVLICLSVSIEETKVFWNLQNSVTDAYLHSSTQWCAREQGAQKRLNKLDGGR